MRQALIQLLLYGLIAGFSALAFAATIAVGQAGRLKVLGFGVGFVFGQLLSCSLFVIVGVAATGWDHDRHPWVQVGLEALLAIVLTAVALRVRRKPETLRAGSGGRVRLALERLGRLSLLTTLLAGLVLGIGGPKRVLLTALAAASITTAGVDEGVEVGLVIWYVALATAVVWVPVILFVVLDEQAVSLVQTAQKRLARHQKEVTVYALLLLAAGLILDAISLV